MKNISNLFLSISIIVLIYILYKDIIYHKGVLHNFYWKYYIISTFLILFSITTYFINKEKKIKLLKISFYLIIFLYSVEGSLNLKQIYHVNKLVDKLENNLNKSDNFDKRTVAEYVLEENIKPKDFLVYPTIFRDKNNLKILPLSSKSFTNSFVEDIGFGYYHKWQTDRYGFRNFDDVWDKNEVEAILLGDSYLMPGEMNESISANLKKLINENRKLEKDTEGSVIELAISGGGTLYEYAIAKEYMLNKKVKNLILFYFEPNDLTNLQTELKDPILNKYFEQEKFIQNLIYKQNIVDSMYNNSDYAKLYQNNRANSAFSKLTISQKLKFRKYKFEWSRFAKFYELRELTIESKKNKPLDEFKILMKKFKKLSKNNNTNFYFVYVPGINRYLKNFEVNESSVYYEEIIKILKNLEINIIDLNKLLYSKVSNPLKYFPLESFGHTTLNANIEVSKIIFERIYNKEIK